LMWGSVGCKACVAIVEGSGVAAGRSLGVHGTDAGAAAAAAAVVGTPAHGGAAAEVPGMGVAGTVLLLLVPALGFGAAGWGRGAVLRLLLSVGRQPPPAACAEGVWLLLLLLLLPAALGWEEAGGGAAGLVWVPEKQHAEHACSVRVYHAGRCCVRACHVR